MRIIDKINIFFFLKRVKFYSKFKIKLFIFSGVQRCCYVPQCTARLVRVPGGSGRTIKITGNQSTRGIQVETYSTTICTTTRTQTNKVTFTLNPFLLIIPSFKYINLIHQIFFSTGRMGLHCTLKVRYARLFFNQKNGATM